MLIENSFEVSAPIDAVWRYFQDVPGLAPCLPGTSLDEVVDDDTFKGTVVSKVGPIKLTFSGTATVKERDEAGKRIVIQANGKEARGRGTAAMTVTATLAPAGAGTKVDVSQDLTVSGTAAQFGRGMIADVTAVLLRDFATCVQANIEQAGGAKAAASAATEATAGATAAGATAAGAAAAGAAAGAAKPAAPAAAAKPVGGIGLAFKAAGLALKRFFGRLFGKRE